MIFLLNLLFAFLAGMLANYLLATTGVSDPIKIILAIIVGFVVFFANLAAQVI